MMMNEQTVEALLFSVDGLIVLTAWMLFQKAKTRFSKVILLTIMCSFGYFLIADLDAIRSVAEPYWLFKFPIRAFLGRGILLIGLMISAWHRCCDSKGMIHS